MQYRTLGTTGMAVSEFGLGTMVLGAWGNSDHDESIRIIHAALDAGINFVDTADVYAQGESEEIVGKALKGRRDDVVLATKFWNPMGPGPNERGASRHWIVRAVEDSLRRLRTDYIDLYQMHQPDPRTPIEETLRALDDLVRQGKVRYIGCSNFPAWQVTEAQWTAKTCGLNAFVSCQDEYSLVFRKQEAELMPAMRKLGLGLLPFFPLASGLLTGKYRRNVSLPSGTRLANTQRLADRYLTDRNWAIAEKLGDFVEARGHTMLELAFSWLLAQSPVSSVIAGATRPEQLEQNVKAGGWKLSAEELTEVDRLSGA